MPMSPTDLKIVAAHSNIPLRPAPINPDWIIEGNPTASAATVSRSSDKLASTVVWECTEGKFNWHYDIDETVLILEGAIVVESDDMTPTRYGPGDIVLFRKGAHARWTVVRKVRKVAFCQRVQPRIFGLGLRIVNRLARMLPGAPQAASPLGA